MRYCHHIVLAAFAVAVGLAGSFAAREAQAEIRGHCDYPGLLVTYDDPSELDEACGAFAEIMVYFQRLDFDIRPTVALYFADHPGDSASAHGYFDPIQSQIVVYRTSDVNPWGLPWSSKFAGSFLRHELAHMAIWQVVHGDTTRLPGEWQEFIAYAIQIDLMDQKLRTALLARQADVQAFDSLEQINELTYSVNPEGFAVAAYKTYLANDGAMFVGRLLRSEIMLPRFSDPFLILPDQAHTNQN